MIAKQLMSLSHHDRYICILSLDLFVLKGLFYNNSNKILDNESIDWIASRISQIGDPAMWSAHEELIKKLDLKYAKLEQFVNSLHAAGFDITKYIHPKIKRI